MKRLLALACLCALIAACSSKPKMNPPIAEKKPARLEKHGQTRVDDYFWLNKREDPEVIRYLEAENAYTEAMMAHTKPLQETLFREFRQRIKQTDESVPYRREGAFFYSRTVTGKDYPIYCRRMPNPDSPEEILIDVNEVARGKEFCSVPSPQTSPDQQLLAYAADFVGRRFYDIRFKNLRTGETLPETIAQVTANFVWANDNKTLFYVRQDPETLRAYQVYRHTIGADPAADELVYGETDDTFHVAVFRTKSRKYLMIASLQSITSEYRYLDASRPDGRFRVFHPRRRGHEYGVDHAGGFFYIRTNDQARNFRLMKTPETNTGRAQWTEVVPHQDDVYFEDFDLFRDHLVVTERKAGLLHLRVKPWSGEGEHYIDFGEPAYVAAPAANFEYDTATVRYQYASMTTPGSTYDYDMVRREKKLLKRDEVGGGFDPAHYQTERLWATARDGVKVPISLVYKKPFARNGSHPLLLYGYGSYGASMEASFSPFRVSLLDRGFVYAIAHIRGGEEMGRAWYDSGKLLRKKNTFTDYIDCAEFLVKEKYASPRRLFGWGGSAGGLLMGAVITMRPDLMTGVIAEVPFVDVVTTMLDDSIPLTTSEYDEWGNPNEKESFDYMLSYSPYDQTRAAEYPHMLVTAGLHDSQVQYWEPAKWVAKLRAVRKDNHRLLLDTEMKAGHGGLTAREDRYRETAMRYAFLLDIAGISR
jgi:oligopeptidase B